MTVVKKMAGRVIVLLALLIAATGAAGAAPTNDNFASATAVTGTSGTVTGSNVGATKETGEPTHSGGSGVSIWWKWTPSTTGPVTFTTAASGSNIVMAVYTGAAVTSLSAATATSGTTQSSSSLTFFAVTGTSYYVAVDSLLGLTGTITLSWTQAVPPASGWWWNPNEPGRGFTIEVTAISPLLTTPRIFFGAFGYDTTTAAPAVWYTSSGIMSSVSSYSGTLYQFSGGVALGSSSFKAASLVGSVGSMTLSFTSATAGTLTWPGGTVPIQRYEFVANGLTTSPITGAPQTGWWWNSSEPGHGLFIETQGSAMQIGSFMYDANGRATWYVSQNTVTAATTYTGRILEYAGGQSMLSTYRQPQTAADRGVLSITFSSTTAGTVTLPSGRSIAISRFPF